jgi:hypothetical protein
MVQIVELLLVEEQALAVVAAAVLGFQVVTEALVVQVS